jgi:GAF domain-containing protein
VCILISQALRQYYDVVRPSEPSSLPESPTTRTEIDRFQRIVVTARKTFGTKISLLSLVDEKRQFFKCEAGLGMYVPPSIMMSLTFRNVETDREITFCGHTILSNEPMVVLNAEKDWRLAGNPLVTGWPYVRFYAGAPVRPLCTRV